MVEQRAVILKVVILWYILLSMPKEKRTYADRREYLIKAVNVLSVVKKRSR